MFLFPDAGRDYYPGMFRAVSLRPVWVDWRTGRQSDLFASFAYEWWNRWNATMEGAFSSARLQDMLQLPIDYYVLRRSHKLAGFTPVYSTPQFVVYDARTLRDTGYAKAPIHEEAAARR